MKWLDDIIEKMDMSLTKLQEIGRTEEPGVLQSMGLQRVRYDSNSTTTTFLTGLTCFQEKVKC